MRDRHPLPRRWATFTVALVILASSAGCRLDLTAEVELHPDGSGAVVLTFHLDDTLVEQLDQLGVDPTAEVASAVADDPDWTLERFAHETGDGIVVTLQRQVSDPDELGTTLRQLAVGLAPEDPALLVDLDLILDDEGRSTVEGEGWLRPPSTAGLLLDGEPVGPAGADLAQLVSDAVTARLVLTLPGEVLRSDADEVDGRTVTWQLPQDASRPIQAQAAGPSWWDANLELAVVAGAVLALVVLLILALLLRRRRARRRARRATSWV